MAPVYRMVGGRDHLVTAFSIFRLINLSFGCMAVCLIFRSMARVEVRPAGVLIGSWIALHPLLIVNTVRVANDSLAFLFGTVVVSTALRVCRSCWKFPSLVIAIALPLAILTKSTNLILVPLMPVFLFAAVAQGVRASKAVAGFFLISIFSGLLLAPYFCHNFLHYGSFTLMAEAVANRAAGRSFSAVWSAFPIRQLPLMAASWWVVNGLWVGGWSFLRPPRVFQLAYALLLGICAMSVLKHRKRLAPSIPFQTIVICLVVSVQCALTVHAVESYSATGRVMTNPWYAAIAIPWVLVIFGCGANEIRHRWLRRVVLFGLPALFLAADCYGIFGLMMPAYYCAPVFGRLCFQRMTCLHPAYLGPFTLLASGSLLVAGILAAIFLQRFGRNSRV
jgi:hypothetical protein